MLKIRRPLGRLIFNMGIAIPGKTVFLIETAPRCFKTWHKKPSGLWLVEMVEEALLQVPGCLPQDLLHQVPVPPTIFQLNLKFNEICNALVHHIFGQSQWNFAHLKMITLSWHVQNFVEIGWAYFKTGHYKFLSNRKSNRNDISGTGGRPGGGTCTHL